jgi:alpha-tubulin suppressor-like RCC1 family protein
MWSRGRLVALGSAVVVALSGACTSLLGDFSSGVGPNDAGGTVDSRTVEASSPRGDAEGEASLDAGGQDSGGCASAVCATAIGANGHHTCVTLSDQTLRCWGSNTYGECGPNADGGPTPVTVPGLGPVRYARAGDTATCALLIDGSVWCWGDNSRGTLGVADAGGLEADGASIAVPVPIQVVDAGTAAVLGVGAYHACIVTTATPAELLCWGSNAFGQAGVPDASTVFTPTVVPTTNVIRVVLGAFETCVQRSDAPLGECFGDNVNGELGLGITGDAGDSGTDKLPHPVPAAVDLGAWGPIATFVHSTGYHMGVVLQSGQVATWGANNDGQLGLGDDSGASQPTPALIPDFDDVTEMSFTQYSSCAARSDGTVWCWGSTAYGQTGSSTNGGPVQYAPAQVPGLSQVANITAGLDHVCALLDGGSVECWGWNTAGELGRSTSAAFDPSPAPVQF